MRFARSRKSCERATSTRRNDSRQLTQTMSTPGGNTHVVTVEGDASGFAQRITADSYTFSADEPAAGGGTGTGPDPYQLLLAALGTCKSMTAALYARRKQWPLTRVRVQL